MDRILFATRPSLSSTQMAKTTSISFTMVNKITKVSVENRIDYHLERIMKRQRLIYFKNSIRNLRIEDRIVESILEIMHTNHNLINSRMNSVQVGRNLCRILRQTLSKDGGDDDDFWINIVLSQTVAIAKNVCPVLVQLNWALNSNKEHLKYLAKVHALPEIYRRGEDADQQDIHIKSSIINMVMECEKTMAISQHILDVLKQLLIMVYLKTLI